MCFAAARSKACAVQKNEWPAPALANDLRSLKADGMVGNQLQSCGEEWNGCLPNPVGDLATGFSKSGSNTRDDRRTLTLDGHPEPEFPSAVGKHPM